MPTLPAEVQAEFTVHAAESSAMDDAAVRATRTAAVATGLALDTGPTTTGLSGTSAEVLDALRSVVEAALDAGGLDRGDPPTAARGPDSGRGARG